MGGIDHWFKRVDFVKTGRPVNIISQGLFIASFVLLGINAVITMNYIFSGVDFCDLLLAGYKIFRLPMTYVDWGDRQAVQFFCYFEIVARFAFWLYIISHAALLVALLLANIMEPPMKVFQIMLFFLLIWSAGLACSYSDKVLAGFYKGWFVWLAADWIFVCLLLPLIFMALCFGLRRGSRVVVRR